MYSPESSVRKTGSYIYEEFMPTDGTDVKVEHYLSIDLLRIKAVRMTAIQHSSGVHCGPRLCSC